MCEKGSASDFFHNSHIQRAYHPFLGGMRPELHQTIRIKSEEIKDTPNHLSPTNPYPVPLLMQPLMQPLMQIPVHHCNLTSPW